MGKAEFIDGLSISLKGKVDDNEYRKQIEYYSSYISKEVAAGRTEEEVVAELGDPRLIAKTIVHTYGMKDNPINSQYRTYEDSNDYEETKKTVDKSEFMRIIRMILVICIVLCVISIVLKLFFAVVPLILLFIVVMVILKFINGR